MKNASVSWSGLREYELHDPTSPGRLVASYRPEGPSDHTGSISARTAQISDPVDSADQERTAHDVAGTDGDDVRDGATTIRRPPFAVPEPPTAADRGAAALQGTRIRFVHDVNGRWVAHPMIRPPRGRDDAQPYRRRATRLRRRRLFDAEEPSTAVDRGVKAVRSFDEPLRTTFSGDLRRGGRMGIPGP